MVRNNQGNREWLSDLVQAFDDFPSDYMGWFRKDARRDARSDYRYPAQ